MISDKEIEEAFYKHKNSSFAQYLRENFENIGIKWDKSSFTAGANWMQEKNAKEIEQLKQRLEEIDDLKIRADNVLNLYIELQKIHAIKTKKLGVSIEALEKIKLATGESTLQWKIAHEALTKISAEKGEINEKI